MITEKIIAKLRDIPDFPKPGIIFKDITPILKDADLCKEITEALAAPFKDIQIDGVAGIESRGFLFGMMMAQILKVPFVPIRKAGKLPYKTISQAYSLEYGEAVLEIHEDAFQSGSRILIHDDLLATGGTVVAASKLVQKLGASVAAYSFLIGLDFLGGESRLSKYSPEIHRLVRF
ncbi:MAG: adenine phosphoribosyltransferase [Pedobacter sp.]|nr:MAG: adenine phosphoribosyltransferase [Pedobacter sp.]